MRDTSKALSLGKLTCPPSPTRTHGTNAGTGALGEARTSDARAGSSHRGAPARVTASRALCRSGGVRPTRATRPRFGSVIAFISLRCASRGAPVYSHARPCGQRRHEVPPCA